MTPKVSVIVTTKNNQATLDACLQSIISQTTKELELIVVDNKSTDKTLEIAQQYTKKVYTKGPERSAQRNYAVQKARGEYVLIIDSDMELTDGVVASCLKTVSKAVGAVIVPEESFGEGFWAQCKKLERSFYVGQDDIEAARFFRKDLYAQLGGYSVTMTGGEDWDLTRRVRARTKIGRATAYVYHNEGRPSFLRTVKKMYYYGSHAHLYFAQNTDQSAITSSAGPLYRFKLFLSQPKRLFARPLVGLGVLLLKTAEYGAAGLGMIIGKWQKKGVHA